MNFLRKFITYALLVCAGVAVGAAAFLAVCYVNEDKLFYQLVGARSPAEEISPQVEATNAELTQFAYKVLDYIKNGDYAGLSEVVHPEYGVVFSPYATIHRNSNKCVTAAQVAAFGNAKHQYVWGKYAGKGSPIELTPFEYFKEFVFDKDYTLSPLLGVNAIVKSGNSLENIAEVFPNVRFVDFHFSGTEINSGLDWSSLRLGFEEYEGRLMLTLILHSEWTI